MDISSYAPPPMTSSPHPMSTHQHAIPTSVITPTSLTSGWLPHLNNNIHGGNFVPPTVSSNSHSPIANRIQNSRNVHPGRGMVVRTAADLDMLRMSPSTSRRRIRDEEVMYFLSFHCYKKIYIIGKIFVSYHHFVIYCEISWYLIYSN